MESKKDKIYREIKTMALQGYSLRLIAKATKTTKEEADQRREETKYSERL